jgi:hypothetical protein
MMLFRVPGTEICFTYLFAVRSGSGKRGSLFGDYSFGPFEPFRLSAPTSSAISSNFVGRSASVWIRRSEYSFSNDGGRVVASKPT